MDWDNISDKRGKRPVISEGTPEDSVEEIEKRASMYKTGTGGVERDHKRAVELLRRAVELGSGSAAHTLALMHKNGSFGLERNLHKAVKLFAVAAEYSGKGTRASSNRTTAAQSLFALGNCYAKGLGVDSADEEKAAMYYRRAAAMGSPEAMNALGWMHLRGKGPFEQSHPSAVRMFRKAAAMGSTRAMLHLAHLYHYGSGQIKKNVLIAAEYYQQAASMGSVNAGALYNIGLLLESGAGDNCLSCKELERQEADRGDAQQAKENETGKEEGQQVHATSTRRKKEGKGRGKSLHEEEKRVEETKLKEKDGGELLHQGHWQLRKRRARELAARIYEQAAAAGNANAIYRLALMYTTGVENVLPQAASVAFALHSRAAEMGNVSSLLALGVMHAEGIGVERSEEKAAEIYEQAAAVGSGAAMFNLALVYETGRGKPKDIVKAMVLYNQAATNGVRSARMCVDELSKLSLAELRKKEAKQADAQRREKLLQFVLSSSSPTSLSSSSLDDEGAPRSEAGGPPVHNISTATNGTLKNASTAALQSSSPFPPYSSCSRSRSFSDRPLPDVHAGVEKEEGGGEAQTRAHPHNNTAHGDGKLARAPWAPLDHATPTETKDVVSFSQGKATEEKDSHSEFSDEIDKVTIAHLLAPSSPAVAALVRHHRNSQEGGGAVIAAAAGAGPHSARHFHFLFSNTMVQQHDTSPFLLRILRHMAGLFFFACLPPASTSAAVSSTPVSPPAAAEREGGTVPHHHNPRSPHHLHTN